MATEKVKGPASIEKSYGKPICHWPMLLDAMKDKKHMEGFRAQVGTRHGPWACQCAGSLSIGECNLTTVL